MLISVILCTYNRCESLKDTLNSLQDLETNESFTYEVIIVDNNSNDNTRNTADTYVPRFQGNLRYIFEPRQGKSFALNTGIRASNGDIVAFVDDDEIVDANWLINISATFESYAADCVGGKIVLDCKQALPQWLNKGYLGILGKLDYGDDLLKITSTKYPLFGGNLAIKRSKIFEYGLFREDLGRRGDKLYGNEEIDLFDKMVSTKEDIFYQPKAIVFHKVPAERLKKRHFRKWNYDSGEHEFMLNPFAYKRKNKRYFLGIPVWMFLKLLTNGFNYIKLRLIDKKKPDELFAKESVFFYYLGFAGAAYKARKHK